MLNIVIFGPPGAGKGTQSEKLANTYGVTHLSTGDILRAERKAGTELGQQAQDFINKGMLVPDELVAGVLENEMNKYPQAAGFIFDGFPRNPAQVAMLDGMLNRRNGKVTVVVALEVPDRNELIRRIVERGKLSGRADDQDPEVVGNRLMVYENETAPVIEVYQQRGEYRGVNGANSIDEVFTDLCVRIDIAKAPAAPIVPPVAPIVAHVAPHQVVRPVKKTVAKKAPAKKAVAPKAPVKKAPAKKVAAPKAPAKKAPAKKVVAKKAAPQKLAKPVKKAVVKKAVAKKAAVKKVVKKAVVKKAAVKKVVVKKAAKKVAPKKVAVKKAVKKVVAKKKIVAKKAAVKKVVKKVVAKKKAVVKKAAVKKVVAKKKAVAKKAPVKKATKKVVVKKAVKKAAPKKAASKKAKRGRK